MSRPSITLSVHDEATELEKKLVRLVLTGVPRGRAYQQCGYHGSPIGSSTVCANTILQRPRVQVYMDELKDRMSERFKQEEEQDFLSLDEIRRYCADAVRTPISEVTEHHPLAEELTVTASGDRKIKMFSKAKAIETEARISGHFKDKMELKIGAQLVDLTNDFQE